MGRASYLMSDHQPTDQPTHESVLDRQICLMLNRSWLPVGLLSTRKALVALAGESTDHHVRALDMTFDEWGNLLSATPTTWEDWQALPVRENDLYVQTHKAQIRVPTVLVTMAFNKVPIKRPRVSSRSIYDRDGGRCQYTGKELTRSSASLDHVLPKSRGGRDDFLNLVLCDKEVNMAKADQTPDEAGLTLLRKPFEPKGLPVSATITANHVDWLPFLVRKT